MKITTAYPFIKTNIERNKKLIDLFNIESSVAKLEMVAKLRVIKRNEKYIETLNEINKIEAKQLYEYSVKRAAEVAKLTEIINKRELELSDIKADILRLVEKSLEVVGVINALNASVPDMTYITNISSEPLMEYEKKCSY